MTASKPQSAPAPAPARRLPAGARGAAPEAAHGDRGAAARRQLLAHATRIFSLKGFVGASTREICDAAGVNVASIHYYFGDKEGLYRAVLLEPITQFARAFEGFDDPALPLESALRTLLAPFVSTSDDAAHDRAVMRLHLREMLEPGPVFREVVERSIVPHHEALVRMLGRHVGADAPDEAIHQLAFALIAMAQDYCMSREFMSLLVPGAFERADAEARILERLVGYGTALIRHEAGQRAAAGRSAAPRRRTAMSPRA